MEIYDLHEIHSYSNELHDALSPVHTPRVAAPQRALPHGNARQRALPL